MVVFLLLMVARPRILLCSPNHGPIFSGFILINGFISGDLAGIERGGLLV